MITPNKMVTLKDSALGAVGFILEKGPDAIDLITLHNKTVKKFESVDQFLLAIDVLYVLGRIEIDFRTRIVTYVN